MSLAHLWATLWASVFVAGLFVEVAALIDTRRDDTLSEHVWHLNCFKWFRVLFTMSWFWLTWHFFFSVFTDTFDDFPLIVDDIVVLIVGGVVGFLLPKPSEKRARCQ